MKKEEFESITQNETKLNDLTNSDLVKYMDLLSEDFDLTKEEIIKMTYYLDRVEELYNKCLNVYNSRVK